MIPARLREKLLYITTLFAENTWLKLDLPRYDYIIHLIWKYLQVRMEICMKNVKNTVSSYSIYCINIILVHTLILVFIAGVLTWKMDFTTTVHNDFTWPYPKPIVGKYVSHNIYSVFKLYDLIFNWVNAVRLHLSLSYCSSSGN